MLLLLLLLLSSLGMFWRQQRHSTVAGGCSDPIHSTAWRWLQRCMHSTASTAGTNAAAAAAVTTGFTAANATAVAAAAAAATNSTTVSRDAAFTIGRAGCAAASAATR